MRGGVHKGTVTVHAIVPALVPLSVSREDGTTLCCEYQRQRYEVMPTATAKELAGGEELVGADDCAHAVRLISCPIDRPHTHYAGSTGLRDEAEELGARDRLE